MGTQKLASDPGITISSECLAALLLRNYDLNYVYIDHVLINEGFWSIRHPTGDQFLTSAKISIRGVDEMNGL